ncbi:Elongation factor Ts, mitochondrial [Chytridiales sp. JEL 0842]|nr:Elongation factor Ts, mitochondrial [Chytridiales sp. JEL 0842]
MLCNTLLRRSCTASLNPSVSFIPISSAAFSTAAKPPSLATLVSKLRKETECTIAKAREALTLHNNDYAKALHHLQSDTTSSVKLASKLASRVAKEGMVAFWVEPTASSKAVMLEVNCETDFVSRGDVFKGFVASTRDLLASSPTIPLIPPSPDQSKKISLFNDMSVAEWLETQTIQDKPLKEHIIYTIGKVGENIRIRRALSTTVPSADSSTAQTFYGGYAHGASDNMGRLAALVALQVSPSSKVSPNLTTEAQKLAKQMAQQVVGFGPSVVDESELSSADGVDLDSAVLLRQGFMMGGGTVAEVLEEFGKKHGVEAKVLEFKRYELGEGIVKEEGDFAAEVLKAAGLQ